MPTCLAMVSLRNGSAELFRRKPKLANTQEFPRGNSAAMNYSRCCALAFFVLLFQFNLGFRDNFGQT